MRCLKHVVPTLLLLLTACAHSPSQTVPVPAFANEHFAPVAEAVRPEQLFQLDSEMKAFVSRASRHGNSASVRIRMLADLVSLKHGFEYDNSATLVARETYARRAGNCMSLVVMTAALARELGLGVEYQMVKSPPVWDRQGGVVLLNDHINIRLTPKIGTSAWDISGSISTTIDFLPTYQIRGYHTERISESEMIARFYNNLAAEAMIDGTPDLAHHYLKRALQQDPDLSAGWNALGVLYRRQGLESQAEQVYQYAATLAGDDSHALHNLALLLASQGRLTEWAQVHKKIELARLNNPFYYYDMAELAYQRGDFSKALSQYRKAVKLADYHHEFHFGLSRAYFQLGQLNHSEDALQAAVRLAPVDERQRYQLKLRALRHY
ncbi:lipopolysaccharide assembly protein LapB [Ferrimonas sp. SCSIO 43195]|uniref:tetratricopeptide repeat protein n=1 Tax=Ferrimonas sp. SCSIO 43195 TaxID=2822844 RepID=UPI002075D643|nr:tetratricopeptide repeat protein [Ferrimonas sp. SCSIO 43195]USD36999.1 tetratricopeptide repeat protein [Ferrimonas sp. SCSIO 43195]